MVGFNCSSTVKNTEYGGRAFIPYITPYHSMIHQFGQLMYGIIYEKYYFIVINSVYQQQASGPY